MILAFVGAVQLKLFGAQIFIADLVGLGMAREMGAMMTAILMAGRTGAAFAAELGSMTVNDEIDALKTSGFSPMEFLVLPRILALCLTVPFLTLYADVLGMFGGALVAAGLFDISFNEYVTQISNRLRLIDFQVGIGKSAIFGILVAVAGCMRGLQCQRNATSVGLATTSAVVTGIVFVVISDAVMTLIVTTLNVFKR
jgi:phospholipid/cholesterol/gamma-HCH transport system permease protein